MTNKYIFFIENRHGFLCQQWFSIVRTHLCNTHLKERATDFVSTQSPLPRPSPSQCPMHPCKGPRPHTLSELYSCSLAWRAGEGKTQMRAESLCRAVSQTLVETQELMNAARSQCVAQQLQLYSKQYLSEGNRQEWHYFTYACRRMSPNSYVCALTLSVSCVCVCVWCNSFSTVGRNDSGLLGAQHSH